MARQQTCPSLGYNSPPGGKNEFTRGTLTKGSDTYIPIPAVSYTLTSVPTFTLLFINEQFK